MLEKTADYITLYHVQYYILNNKYYEWGKSNIFFNTTKHFSHTWYAPPYNICKGTFNYRYITNSLKSANKI